MINVQRVYSIIVPLQLSGDFSFLYVDSFNQSVWAANSDSLGAFIKAQTVSDCITSIHRHELLHHSDVPELNNSIRVASRHVLSAYREGCIINCVEMSVESLDSKACPHIPDRSRLVCWSSDEKVGKRLEVETIDWVGVRAELLAHLQTVKIKQLNGAISWCRQDEVASVVELEFPDRPGMHVSESVSNGAVDEVPHFDGLVSSSSGQMWACRVEVNCGDPVFVAFASHDVLLVIQVPDFPSTIVGRSSHDLLLRVQAHAADTLWVRVYLLGLVCSFIEQLELLSQVRVWSCILWPGCISSLHDHVIYFASLSLSFHLSFKLLLDALLMSFNCVLDLLDSLLGLVLLQL